MINKNIINTLSQVNGISNSVILKYPTTIMNSPAGDIIARVQMDKLDNEAFPDIGIYNLSEFLNTFKLFDEPKVQIRDNIIHIDAENTSLQYLSTNISLLEDFNKSEDIFTKTSSVPTVAEFQLTEDDIKKLKQASGVFKDLTEIIFESQDEQMYINLGASNKFNAKSNNYSVSKAAQTTKEFNIKIPVENFNVLPSSDYTVLVKYNSSRDAYRLILESNDIDMKILMAVKK